MGLGDDIVYLVLLAFTVGISHFVRKIQDQKIRQWTSTLIGVFVTYLVSGKHTMYPIILVVVNYLIIQLIRKSYCQWISLTFCFTFLTFFRTCAHFHLDPPPDHTNAIMMILSLKMIGLTFEVQADKNEPNKKSEPLNPSLCDTFHYAFCHGGVLVGPYYKYQTYEDMVKCPYNHHIPYIDTLRNRLKYVPAYAILYLLSIYLYPIQYIASEQIYDRSLLYRLFYVWPVFFTFRMRMYIGFILGECSCIMAGIGCYPQVMNSRSGHGPKDRSKFLEWKSRNKDAQQVELDFEATLSINEYQCEFLSSMRDGMRNWNMTVQFWLAMFIYKPFPIKPLKVPVTMLVSAVWHGLNPGYYLCLMNVPFVTAAQDRMERLTKDRLSATGLTIFSWINWFITMALFSYLSIAFLTLNLTSTLLYWSSIYYAGHVLIATMFVACFLFGPRNQSKSNETKTH